MPCAEALMLQCSSTLRLRRWSRLHSNWSSGAGTPAQLCSLRSNPLPLPSMNFVHWIMSSGSIQCIQCFKIKACSPCLSLPVLSDTISLKEVDATSCVMPLMVQLYSLLLESIAHLATGSFVGTARFAAAARAQPVQRSSCCVDAMQLNLTASGRLH